MADKVKLDSKDVKILYELSKNSRTPSTKMAKLVHLSREVVDYRIKRLIKNRIITGFITLIDLEKIGYNRGVFFLQLERASPEKEEEIINYLINHPFIGWSGLSPGKWNFVADIVARDQTHMYEILKEILNKYAKYIGEYRINTTVGGGYFPSKYYGKIKEIKLSRVKEFKLDSTDIKILKILSRNTRADYVSLSKKINLTANGIRKRITNLIQAGIITDFTIISNFKILDYAIYDIIIKFENLEPSKEKELLAYVKDYPYLIYYFSYIGEWNLQVGVLIRKVEELKSFMTDLRNRFTEVVKILDISPIFDEVRGPYLPEGIFDDLMKRL